jgi:hypothetical protein
LDQKAKNMFSTFKSTTMEERQIDITLSIESKDDVLIAHLLFFNNTSKKYYLDKYTICYNETFTRNVFTIIDERNKLVDYIGIIAKRKVALGDFISLDVGESVKTRVVLNNGYRLKRGMKYHIQYSVYNLDYLRVQDIMLIESNKVEVIYK